MKFNYRTFLETFQWRLTIFILVLLSYSVNAQINTSIRAKPSQYRRGVELQTDYQSYAQKYSGKNLNEEKRRLFPLESTGVWTELNPKVPRVDYIGIHFFNKDTGWVCGDLGAIIKTTDGGQNWITEETNTTTPILKVNSFDGQIVIAAGFNGIILRSTNGGENWTQITSGITGDLWGLQMINDNLGWACGKSNSLIKTTNAGLTWERIYTTGYSSDYWWIDFLTEGYGFIAANGKVIRTTDGGNTWDIIQAGDNQALYSIDVIDSLHIAAAGYGGTGYYGKNVYSNDGGNTWIIGGQTPTDPINCIKYINADTGYFVMSEIGIWKTTNRGQTWNGGIGNIGEFEIQLFSEQNIGYDAGTGLRVYKADGSLDSWHRQIINDDFYDVYFINEEKGFAISGPASNYQSLYKTTDAGIHWQLVSGVPGGQCIIFTDSFTGFIGTTTSLILKTTNGGESWYQMNGITEVIAKIFFINAQTGWAVGGPKIFKTSDSGENWIEQINRPSANFKSLSFVDSLYGWASLSGWRPYKTTNSGINWLEQTDLNFYNTNDVYFLNEDNGWITDLFDGPFKTIDGGVTWTSVPEIEGARSFYIFPDVSHWLVTGVIVSSNIIYKKYMTYDTGNSWIDISNDVPVGFNGFQTPTNMIGYAVGGSGLILRYDDTTYTPVEFNSFSANVKRQTVLLKWTTASEINNRLFEIQRKKVEAQDQSEWKRIGFKNGNGTSTIPHRYFYTDKNVAPGEYKYRLKQLDFDGTIAYSKEVGVDVNPPTKFTLKQNYPNPFNPTTNIEYRIPNKEFVSIKVYNTLGEEVETLVNEEKQAGTYEVKFDGDNLPSGVYIYRLSAGYYSAAKKFIFLK